MNKLDTTALFQRLSAGDRSALAQAITLVESQAEAQQATAAEIVNAALAVAVPSLRLGITGIPGVGKSTLIDSIGLALIEQGHRVAVLAIDPSSARSGGSILGDKTRMERLSVHEAAFVRPTATGGNLGGVGRRTRETIALCEAAGYDRIVVETVGVGQNELEVERLIDLNILVMMPGTGDELQGIKRGIMETADVIVLNKSDEVDAAVLARANNDLQQALQLLPPRHDGHRPKVLACSGLRGTGIHELVSHITALQAEREATGLWQRRRAAQLKDWVWASAEEQLLLQFRTELSDHALRTGLDLEVGSGRTGPTTAARRLVEHFRTSGAPPRGEQ